MDSAAKLKVSKDMKLQRPEVKVRHTVKVWLPQIVNNLYQTVPLSLDIVVSVLTMSLSQTYQI